MTDNEIFIQRLIDEGGYNREHAERAVALIVEEEVPMEGMIEILIALKYPKLDEIIHMQGSKSLEEHIDNPSRDR
jgi:hypothetical protein